MLRWYACITCNKWDFIVETGEAAGWQKTQTVKQVYWLSYCRTWGILSKVFGYRAESDGECDTEYLIQA